MKLMFTLRGSDNQDTDLVATVDGRTTVGQAAEAFRTDYGSEE